MTEDPQNMTYEQYLRDRERRLSQEGAKEGPPDDSFGDRVSSFYHRVSQAWRSIPAQHPVDKALEVGAKKAFNQVSNTVVGAGLEAVKHLGHFTSPEAAASFAQVYGKKVRDINPVQFDVDPERAPGIYGAIESAAQFAAGMTAFSNLGPIAEMGHVVKGAVAGGLSDLTVMDPYEERLSDLVERGPDWLSNPITRYLKSDEDDGLFEAKFKAAAEGVLTGAVVDGVIGGVKALKVRTLVKAGKLTAEEGQARIAEALAPKAPDPDELVKVEHTPGEPSRLVVDRKKYEALVGPEGSAGDDLASRLSDEVEGGSANGDEIALEVSNPSQAESLAAAMNGRYKRSLQPREVTEEQVASMRAISDRIDSGVDPVDAARMEQGTTLNFSWISTPEDARKALVSAAEALHGAKEPFRESSLAKDGQTITWEETAKRAAGLVEANSLPQFISHLQELAGTAEKIPAYLDAARGILQGLGSRVARVSALVDSDPENLAHVDDLMDSFESLVNTHDAFTGTVSPVARALNILKRPTEAIDPESFAKEAQAGAESGVEGEAKGAAKTGAAAAPTAAPSAKQGGPKTAQLTASGPREVDALASNANYVPKIPATKKAAADLTRADILALARQVQFADGDADRILKALRGTTLKVLDPEQMEKPGFWDKVNGVRANLMLSGPTTHETNFINNAINSFLLPAEYSLGGALTGDKALARQGWDMFVGGFSVVKDAAKMALRTLSENRPAIDPDFLTLDDPRVAEDAMSGFAAVINAPSRALMGMDEFFKQFNYRSHVRAQSLRSARTAALARGLEGKEAAQWIAGRVAEDLDNAFDIRGGAVNVNALQYARESTFTQNLQYGEGKRLQDWANASPAMRFIFPFVRTPVNIFRFNWQHLPALGMLQRQMREDLRAGGSRRAVALGKQAAGTMMYSMAAGLAAGGMLTGGGPKSPELRQQWLAAGNRPYTLKAGDKQIDYRRIEPFGTALSMVADAVQMAGDLKEGDGDHILSVGIAAMLASVSSKTFLIGMSDFFDAASSGEWWRVDKWVSGAARSFTPNILNQINPDDYWRESRGIVDDIASRTPGWSETLEPRRNIFGEPMIRQPGLFQRALNPFTVTDATKDPVANKLLELGTAMPMPREQLDGGVNLTDRKAWDNGTGQSPYDRMLELMGKPKHGKSVRQRLTELVESPRWEGASGGTDVYPGGMRMKLADRIIQSAQEVALHSMLDEYPKLQEAVKQSRRDRAASLRSGGLLEAVSR